MIKINKFYLKYLVMNNIGINRKYAIFRKWSELFHWWIELKVDSQDWNNHLANYTLNKNIQYS